MEYKIIDIYSVEYKQVIDLRYNVFFKEFELPRSIVYDDLEKDSIHLAVTIDNNVIGYCRLSMKDNIAQISQMVVDSDFRGQNIGKSLMKIMIDKALKHGNEKIFLDSRIPAIQFYSKFGFISIGENFSSKKTGLLHRRMEKEL